MLARHDNCVPIEHTLSFATEARIARGVYIDADELAARDDRGRYLLRIRAVAGTRKNRPVISHWSAAAIHDLPVRAAWPSEVHTTVPASGGGRSRIGVVSLPRPMLQLPHYDRRGFIGEPDFSWPEYGVLGEADGDMKYSDARYTAGRTPRQVFADERRRHNRLAALPRTVRRWDWGVANNPAQLRALLVEAGLPAGVDWR